MPSRTRAELLLEKEALLAREDEILDVLDDPDLGNEEKLDTIEQLMGEGDNEEED